MAGDLYEMAPDVILTSGIQSVTELIINQGKALAAGEWKAVHLDVGVEVPLQCMGTRSK
ncbi:MAG: hypothetical protein JEY99_16045 [Spirochaetales bacterium]|nr:hypothetical protein [Spirochaetales bacterium]